MVHQIKVLSKFFSTYATINVKWENETGLPKHMQLHLISSYIPAALVDWYITHLQVYFPQLDSMCS